MPTTSSPISRRRWVKAAGNGQANPESVSSRPRPCYTNERNGGGNGGHEMRTQVGIVGAGPARLMLSHLLPLEGAGSGILEKRTPDYFEGRLPARLIEQWASGLLVETGVGARMQREGMFHNGVHFAFGGALHYLNFRELVGKGVTIYGQQEVVKDLIARRLSDGGQILFEASDVSVHD